MCAPSVQGGNGDRAVADIYRPHDGARHVRSRDSLSFGPPTPSCADRSTKFRHSSRKKVPAPPHDATGHTWHHSDELLFRLTRDGPGVIAGEDYRTTMPAYRGILSDREIWSVLAYIKSRWPAELQMVQAER